MSIFNSIKNLFDGEKSSSEQYKRDVEATHKQMQKMMANEAARRDHITKCVVLMKECRTKFVSSIMTEREVATKKKRTGIPIDRERTRIREAAIGILTVDIALLDLESIASEADLNRAMNNMGKALRQLIHLDNTTSAISGSARYFVDAFYPGFKNLVNDSENYNAVKKAADSAKKKDPKEVESLYEIPKEIRDRIDDSFVENLLAGDSYEMAMFKAQYHAVPSKEHKSDSDGCGGMSEAEWDRITKLAAQAAVDGDDNSANS